jgi:WD40 repeat protein
LTGKTNEVKRIFSQATAPVTCIAIHEAKRILFAGSWDKLVYAIDLESGKTIARFSGHTDFVKCLTTTDLEGKPILISGGACAAIIVWDMESGKQLHKLKGHTKALQDFAVDTFDTDALQKSLVLFSASSDREIRRWHISLDAAYEVPESLERPILAHDTSVYKVSFDVSGDLWTASADKTVKHLVRDRGWEADTILQHPDFVRDVAVAERMGLIVTACRDEEVRVWDSASEKVVCTYSGHFEEVTGLVVVGQSVVSVSIDGTLRQWGLRREAMEAYRAEIDKEANGAGEENVQKGGRSVLTAEEEAELAELMEDD